jgi:uncharacterized membrane protein SirB2
MSGRRVLGAAVFACWWLWLGSAVFLDPDFRLANITSVALLAVFIAAPFLALASRKGTHRWKRVVAYSLAIVTTLLLSIALVRVELPA